MFKFYICFFHVRITEQKFTETNAMSVLGSELFTVPSYLQYYIIYGREKRRLQPTVRSTKKVQGQF